MKHTKGPWEIHGNGIYPKKKSSNICIVTRQRFDLKPSGQFEEDEVMDANSKVIAMAPCNLEDNIEWVEIHKELMKEGIIIRKPLSDRIMEQLIKSKQTIKNSLE